MLQNLSAQTFRPYGQVLPGSRRPSHYANYHTISLTPEQSVFYKTTAATWLGPAQGRHALGRPQPGGGGGLVKDGLLRGQGGGVGIGGVGGAAAAGQHLPGGAEGLGGGSR